MGARLMDATIDKCGIAIVTGGCITRTMCVRDNDNQRRRGVAKGPGVCLSKGVCWFFTRSVSKPSTELVAPAPLSGKNNSRLSATGSLESGAQSSVALVLNIT